MTASRQSPERRRLVRRPRRAREAAGRDASIGVRGDRQSARSSHANLQASGALRAGVKAQVGGARRCGGRGSTARLLVGGSRSSRNLLGPRRRASNDVAVHMQILDNHAGRVRVRDCRFLLADDASRRRDVVHYSLSSIASASRFFAETRSPPPSPFSSRNRRKMSELRCRCASFVEYDLPYLKTETGVFVDELRGVSRPLPRKVRASRFWQGGSSVGRAARAADEPVVRGRFGTNKCRLCVGEQR